MQSFKSCEIANSIKPEPDCSFLVIFSPGYNRCDISEDETTAALHALYKVPIPQNQHNFQVHTNGTGFAVTTNAHDFNQNHLNIASDPTKKQKLQKRHSAVGTGYPLHSNSQMKAPLRDLENGGLKDVKPSLARGNFTNQTDMQQPSKSASGLAKLNKRKGQHVAGGMSFIHSFHFLNGEVFLLMDDYNMPQLI